MSHYGTIGAVTAEIVPIGRVPESLEQRVAAEIRAEMSRLDVNQRELAAALHISTGEISKLLNGSRPIKVQFIDQVCAALGIDPVQLFGRATRPQPPGSALSRLGESNSRPIHYMSAPLSMAA